MNQNKSQFPALLGVVLFIILSPVWLPLLLCMAIAYIMKCILIYPSMWLAWSPRGIRLLYVYSNSPNWQEHIEREILPRLPKGKIVLNWSERTLWKKFSLASIVFRHFGGSRNFNPLAVVIKPFQRARVFRFHEAFLEFKHGKTASLALLEGDLFDALGINGQPTAGGYSPEDGRKTSA
jgi:hypothetical protein